MKTLINETFCTRGQFKLMGLHVWCRLIAVCSVIVLKVHISVLVMLFVWQTVRLNCDSRHEPRHEKTGFLPRRKTKVQISFAVMISAFVFATQII